MNNYNNCYLKNRKMPKWLLNINNKHNNFKILAIIIYFFASFKAKVTLDTLDFQLFFQILKKNIFV